MIHITIQFDLLAVKIRKMVYVPVDNQLIPEYSLAKDGKEYLRNNHAIVALQGSQKWEERHLKQLHTLLRRHYDLIR